MKSGANPPPDAPPLEKPAMNFRRCCFLGRLGFLAGLFVWAALPGTVALRAFAQNEEKYEIRFSDKAYDTPEDRDKKTVRQLAIRPNIEQKVYLYVRNGS